MEAPLKNLANADANGGRQGPAKLPQGLGHSPQCRVDDNRPLLPEHGHRALGALKLRLKSRYVPAQRLDMGSEAMGMLDSDVSIIGQGRNLLLQFIDLIGKGAGSFLRGVLAGNGAIDLS
jgi:hypothetical protein